ncbi:Gfo/Idh/MocA family protein [Microlunatus soli]|uniref:Predicted dehydrogenase n=1 Tax=Microlunatus soli TaxID=630515 RepID=A0A1H1Z6R7_9ACTN|nr:Gfo/Idh/MocA family oxidoreductase [Microlunatus soli]SDT29398.1 Predicted dehydrogenase [Microlunatus soli]
MSAGSEATKIRIGMVGAGNISGQYLAVIERLPILELVAVADLDQQRAAAVAEKYGARALTVAELVASDDVDVVLNLTLPAAHAEVALQAIAAGKTVYGEKPLAATLEDGNKIIEAARAAGVRVGSAPDTVLGTGIQTARKAVDDGVIGSPIAATATMVTPGHERWHPNPDFYYQPGGGPVLDMGPYYVSALITILGPVRRVIAEASHTRTTRTIGSGDRAGESFDVAVDTHVTGVLVHESGVLSTVVMSFDAAASKASNIEVHGTDGSLIVPDPNRFDGDVSVHPVGGEWSVLPVSAGYRDAGRGYGIADLAVTPADQQIRASGDLALHALDVMLSFLRSASDGVAVEVETSCERPAPVPLGDAPGGVTR